jgi:UDP-N-acetylmuramate: L-alanyl-gamma-D-glutamyl-meso-diaminopimelate ligase
MKVHFIAIGGSVMHQLALALKQKGYTITGSDDEVFEPAKSNLAKEGLLPPQTGWFPEKIHENLDSIILGMHAKQDNPELLKARELKLKIFSFPEYIFQESREKIRVVVGGSHGKTTTTSMIMHVLKKSGKDFDYLVGARLEGFDRSVNVTNAPVIVCEGDEYPASAIEKRPKFHFLFPHIAILTGISWDHINVFPTFDFYLEQFEIFIKMIEPGGLLIFNETDAVLSDLVQENTRTDLEYLPYGLPEHSIEQGNTLIYLENEKGKLSVFGNHNLLNLQAAFYACKKLGVNTKTFIDAISNFTGASKRLEVLSKSDDVIVFRDFAHAPSKVKATIEAVKQQYPHRKLIAVLELHTYSSLNEQFMNEYKGAMDKADEGAVFYSQHALELKRLPVLPKEKVLEGFGKQGLMVLNRRDDLEKWLNSFAYHDTNLVLMSSGNYDGADMLTFANRITKNAEPNIG